MKPAALATVAEAIGGALVGVSEELAAEWLSTLWIDPREERDLASLGSDSAVKAALTPTPELQSTEPATYTVHFSTSPSTWSPS